MSLIGLREYVLGTSLARFMFLDGLAFKTWRMREGEWFEGTYVFDTPRERERDSEFRGHRRRGSPGSRLIGSGPVTIEDLRGRRHRRGPGKVPPGRRPRLRPLTGSHPVNPWSVG